MNVVSSRLKLLRESINASQSTIAGMVGLTQSSINRYENGQAEAPYKVLLWYADYFNVSMDYIFGRTDQPQGKLYDYQPKKIKEKMANKQDWNAFVEACFEPGSPMNAKLKEMIIKMAGDVQE
ncbi:MAG: helix-turn-helix domain-containing protein [Bacillota bacterium]